MRSRLRAQSGRAGRAGEGVANAYGKHGPKDKRSEERDLAARRHLGGWTQPAQRSTFVVGADI